MAAAARTEELSEGRGRRHAVPRSDQAVWEPPANRPDPVEVIEAQNRTRLADLVAVRTGRMSESPFAFLRGSALIMAHDLAATADTGFAVQVCGDAHVANFGLFASPERSLLFDVNDFDETDVGPWEWDVKRLCASAAVVARQSGHRGPEQSEVARAGACAYRTHMARYAAMAEMDLWYARVDADMASKILSSAGSAVRAEIRADVRAARRHTAQAALPGLTALAPDGSRRIVDHPPLVSHDGVDDELLRTVTSGYLASLTEDRRTLAGRFEILDFARKVVGVGSVGTRCFIALLMDDAGLPLLMQVKEADVSALAAVGAVVPVPGRHAGPAGEGWRVVDGQRRMQAASDVFLGWASAQGVDYYLRQLRDMKGSIDAVSLAPDALADYAELCGWVLARAHARSAGGTTAAHIAGYLGTSATFDDAVAGFAVAYAEQNERDFEAFSAAVKSGRLPAETGV